jgi:hypothetical protein
MKKVLILAALLFPTFAMATSDAALLLIANDGAADKKILVEDAAKSKASPTQGAPVFAAPTIPGAKSSSPEKSVAKKEVEVAKKEVGAATAQGKPSVAVPFGQRYIPEAAEQKSQAVKTDAQTVKTKVNGNPLDSESKAVKKP